MPTIHGFRVLTFCRADQSAATTRLAGRGAETENPVAEGGKDFNAAQRLSQISVALAVAAEVGSGKAHAFVPAHNSTKHDFRSDPPVTNRLNQGPFPQAPLLTNTQPDYSREGNSALVDRTVRSNNWIRSDTIFIENEQIEALSNRPPWIAAVLEQPLPGKAPDTT